MRGRHGLGDVSGLELAVNEKKGILSEEIKVF